MLGRRKKEHRDIFERQVIDLQGSIDAIDAKLDGKALKVIPEIPGQLQAAVADVKASSTAAIQEVQERMEKLEKRMVSLLHGHRMMGQDFAVQLVKADAANGRTLEALGRAEGLLGKVVDFDARLRALESAKAEGSPAAAVYPQASGSCSAGTDKDGLHGEGYQPRSSEEMNDEPFQEKDVHEIPGEPVEAAEKEKVIMEILSKEGPLGFNKLKRRTGYTATALSKIIKRLLRDGQAVRDSDGKYRKKEATDYFK